MTIQRLQLHDFFADFKKIITSVEKLYSTHKKSITHSFINDFKHEIGVKKFSNFANSFDDSKNFDFVMELKPKLEHDENF